MIRAGQGLTLRSDGSELLFRGHQRHDWHTKAATQARIAAGKIISLESGGLIGYDFDLKPDG